MRVWDLPPEMLCNQHLLGEHREIHAIWTILTEDKDGYRNHPETKRWEGHIHGLGHRHRKIALEMEERGMNHDSPIDYDITKAQTPDEITPLRKQLRRLEGKDCHCLRPYPDHMIDAMYYSMLTKEE